MKPLLIAALLMLPLMGCKPDATATLPPETMTAEAVGRYCGMNLMEHEGPKGQVVLSKDLGAYWFSSARDTVAFTMMPDEVKDYGGLYVSDMAKAKSWADPGADNWIDAKSAFYVVGAKVEAAMGGAEIVPFGTREAAEAFARDKGGAVRGFVATADIALAGGVRAERLTVTVLPELAAPLLGMDVLGRLHFSQKPGELRIQAP